MHLGALRQDVSGSYSTAIGHQNRIGGNLSTAIGAKNLIRFGGNNSWVFGELNIVNGGVTYGTAIGTENKLGGAGAGGSGSAACNAAVALGYQNENVGSKSMAIGEINNIKVNVVNGYAFGTDNSVDASGGVAIGQGNSINATTSAVASGTLTAVGLGVSNNVGALNSFAIGDSCKVWSSGRNGMAFGKTTDVSGRDAVAFGNSTKAPWYGSFVIGRYNATTNYTSVGQSSIFSTTHPAFLIGGGSNTMTKRNIFRVRYNGRTDIQGETGGVGLAVGSRAFGGSQAPAGLLVDLDGQGEIDISTNKTGFVMKTDGTVNKIKLAIPDIDSYNPGIQLLGPAGIQNTTFDGVIQMKSRGMLTGAAKSVDATVAGSASTVSYINGNYVSIAGSGGSNNQALSTMISGRENTTLYMDASMNSVTIGHTNYASTYGYSTLGYNGSTQDFRGHRLIISDEDINMGDFNNPGNKTKLKILGGDGTGIYPGSGYNYGGFPSLSNALGSHNRSSFPVLIRQNRLDISYNLLGLSKAKEFGVDGSKDGDSIGNGIVMMLRTLDANSIDRTRSWWIYQKPVCSATGVDLKEDRLAFASNNQNSNYYYPFAVVDIDNTPPGTGYGTAAAPSWHQGLVSDVDYSTTDVPQSYCLWPWGTSNDVNLDGERPMTAGTGINNGSVREHKGDIYGNNSAISFIPRTLIGDYPPEPGVSDNSGVRQPLLAIGYDFSGNMGMKELGWLSNGGQYLMDRTSAPFGPKDITPSVLIQHVNTKLDRVSGSGFLQRNGRVKNSLFGFAPLWNTDSGWRWIWYSIYRKSY